MSYTLHKLTEGFILTSEDFIKEDELFLMGDEIIQNSSLHTEEWCKSKQPKVIAQQDQIDFSSLKEEEQKEIGWFDVNKVIVAIVGINYYNRLNKDGSEYKILCSVFQKAQELLSDRTFTLEEVIQFTEKCMILANDSNNIGRLRKFIEIQSQSLSQPKSWKVELKMEDKCWCMKPQSEGCYECIKFLKLTNGKIKITKIL
jgi:hypothetical protein